MIFPLIFDPSARPKRFPRRSHLGRRGLGEVPTLQPAALGQSPTETRLLRFPPAKGRSSAGIGFSHNARTDSDCAHRHALPLVGRRNRGAIPAPSRVAPARSAATPGRIGWPAGDICGDRNVPCKRGSGWVCDLERLLDIRLDVIDASHEPTTAALARATYCNKAYALTSRVRAIPAPFQREARPVASHERRTHFVESRGGNFPISRCRS